MTHFGAPAKAKAPLRSGNQLQEDVVKDVVEFLPLGSFVSCLILQKHQTWLARIPVKKRSFQWENDLSMGTVSMVFDYTRG